MKRNPTPISPETLYPRRLAARALVRALEGYDLGAITRRFNPDDPSQCLPGMERGEFVFGDEITRFWRPLATVYLEPPAARVIVERIEPLVRPAHLQEFDPEALGILPGPGCPDLDVTLDLGDVIEGEGDLLRTAPQRIPPRQASAYRGRPAVRRAFAGYRRGGC